MSGDMMNKIKYFENRLIFIMFFIFEGFDI